MPATPIKKGLTTILWGSGTAVPSGALAAAIVVRASFTDKNGSAIEIENNDGFAAAMVLLNDGFDATLECVYDSAITWPVIGDTVSLKRPNDVAALNCLVASIDPSVERKKEATISIKVHYRPNVTLA